MARWLQAGRVGRAHGLDGSFYVIQGVPGLLTPGANVMVAGRERRIMRRAGTDTRAIVRLDGCEDRPSAEALQGAEILVARDQAPELGPDEWWAEDLEGCAVHDGGRHVGVVRRLVWLPSCEALEVEREGGAAELLVPLVTDAVRTVDVERGEIEIDLRFLDP